MPFTYGEVRQYQNAARFGPRAVIGERLRSRRFELLRTYRVPTIDILNIDFENLSPIILIEGLLNKTEYCRSC